MNEPLFHINELLILSLITFMILRIITGQFRKREYDQAWSPLVLVSVVYIYYLVLGPVISVMEGNTWAYTVNHRPYLMNAWLGGTASFVCIILGFNLTQKISPRAMISAIPDDSRMWSMGVILFVIGFAAFALIAGSGLLGQLDFLEGSGDMRTGYSGAFRNYFLYGINFFIPASCFLLYGWIKKRGNLLILLGSVFIAVSLYLSSGFRYRVVLLALSLLVTWYIAHRRKPNLVFLAVIAFVFISFMGFVGAARQYGRGLDVTRVEEKTNWDLFLQGVGESITFQTTGLLMEQVPEIHEHIGWDPVIQSIVFPVPRRLWPEKPSGDYIETINRLYLINNYLGIGAAVLNYGEYYLAFGWWGIIIGSLILGWIAKKLWLWYKVNRENPLAIVMLAVANGFLYVVISRGYLPQVVMNFFFTVGPCLVIIWWVNRKAKKRRYVEMRRRGEEDYHHYQT